MNLPDLIVDGLAKQCATVQSFRDALHKAGNIRRKIRDCESSIESAYKGFRAIKAAQESAIIEAQNKCEHWIVSYYGDPSGGSDSHYACDICGHTSRTQIPKTLV